MPRLLLLLLYAVLAALATTANGAPVTPILSSKNTLLAARANSKFTHQLSRHSGHGVKYTLSDINVGGSLFNLVLDTAGFDTFIYSKHCKTPECLKIQNRLEEKKIRGLVQSGMPKQLLYSTTVSGTEATAPFTLAGVTAPSHEFVVAHDGTVFVDPTVQGLMGFAIPVLEGQNQVVPFWYTWLKTIAKKPRQFGIYLGPGGGKLHLGHYDSKCIEPSQKLVWLPVHHRPTLDSQSWWMVMMTTITYTNAPQPIPINAYATFDTGAPFTYGPRDQVTDLYYKVFGLRCNLVSASGTSMRACSLGHLDQLAQRRLQRLSATFTFGIFPQVSITLSFADLVELDGAGNAAGKVIVLPDDRTDWLIGVNFLQKVYAVHKVLEDKNGKIIGAKLGLAVSQPC